LHQSVGEVEAALFAEVDIEQNEIRLQLRDALDALAAGRRGADNRDALALQQRLGGPQKEKVVIDDEAADSDCCSISSHAWRRIAASR
jgi:hypothetical protein